MKRHKRKNVNGRVPDGSKVWADLSPDELHDVKKRLERVTGVDFMTVCERLDQEMRLLERQEREAAEAKKAVKR